jgi:curved DNA-binding protein CbpA
MVIEQQNFKGNRTEETVTLESMKSLYEKLKSQNFYERLGISQQADEKTINKSARELRIKYHPDKFSKDEQKSIATLISQLYSEAQATLFNETDRRKYDATLLYQKKKDGAYQQDNFSDQESGFEDYNLDPNERFRRFQKEFMSSGSFDDGDNPFSGAPFGDIYQKKGNTQSPKNKAESKNEGIVDAILEKIKYRKSVSISESKLKIKNGSNFTKNLFKETIVKKRVNWYKSVEEKITETVSKKYHYIGRLVKDSEILVGAGEYNDDNELVYAESKYDLESEFFSYVILDATTGQEISPKFKFSKMVMVGDYKCVVGHLVLELDEQEIEQRIFAFEKKGEIFVPVEGVLVKKD